MSQSSRADLRQKRRRMMIEEDDAPDPRVYLSSKRRRAPESPDTANATRTPPRSISSEQSSESPSTRLKMHFGGRIYRAGDGSPAAKTIKSLGDPAELLGQPDEHSIDDLYDQAHAEAQKRHLPALMASPSITSPPPSPSPVKRSSTPPPASLLADAPVAGSSKEGNSSDSDLEISPTKRDQSLFSSASPFASPSKLNRARRSSAAHQRQRSLIDTAAVDLPPAFNNILILHSALERAIMLHISTEGKAGLIASAVAHASSSSNHNNSSTYRVDIPNLAPFTALRPVVERGSGLRFDSKALSQLLWVWQTASDALMVRSDNTSRGLGFILGRMIDVTKGTGRRQPTWGIGIELDIKKHAPEPSLELMGSSASPSHKRAQQQAPTPGGRDGMSVVALWSQGAEARKELIKQCLGQMVLDQQQVSPAAEMMATLTQPEATPTKKKPAPPANGMLPTPPNSRHKGKSAMSSTSSDADFGEIPTALLPSVHVTPSGDGLASASINYGLLDSGFDESPSKSSSPSNSKTSTKARASSLMERIKNKEQNQNLVGARQPKLGLISPTRKSLKTNTPAAERERQRMAEFKRKSMLSRLPDIADAVYMLFASNTAPPSPSSAVAAAGKGRRAMMLEEVCKVIIKSSKIAMSVSEASESIKLLCELAPAFIHCSSLEGPGGLNKQLWIQAQCGQGGVHLREAKARLRQELVSDS